MSKDADFYRGKLFAASWRGEFELVREVIEDAGVDVNVVDSDGVSALRQVRLGTFKQMVELGQPKD